MLLFLPVWSVPITGFSQQLPRFSQYFANEFIVNPSVAGYDGRTIYNLAARKQWLGFADYTPSSYLLSAQGRILKRNYVLKSGPGGGRFRKSNKGRVGLGGIVYHDLNGAIERTGGQFSYAYHIFIRNSQLSFGLTGNVFQYRINRERAELKNPDSDPLNGLIGKTTIIPDAGIGVNYMAQKYHIGLAVAQVFQSKLKIGNYSDFKASDEVKLVRHYYLMGDYRIGGRYNRNWEFLPSGMFLFTETFKMQTEVSLRAFYKNQYWFGLSGRTPGDIVVMAGLRYGHYYFGYSYDYGFTGISRYTAGSHEICLTAKFGDTARRYRWLDRY